MRWGCYSSVLVDFAEQTAASVMDPTTVGSTFQTLVRTHNFRFPTDADPGPRRDPRAVAAMDKFTWTIESGGEKGMAQPVSQEESACLDRLLLLFWAHYIEDGPHLLCTGGL